MGALSSSFSVVLVARPGWAAITYRKGLARHGVWQSSHPGIRRLVGHSNLAGPGDAPPHAPRNRDIRNFGGAGTAKSTQEQPSGDKA
jgi:hypothetical protein